MKQQIEEIKKAFNEHYERYDKIKFKIAQIKYQEELKREFKEKQRKGLQDQRYKQKIEKDSNNKIEELKRQHDEVLEKLKKAEELLKNKQNDKKAEDDV